MAFPWGLPSSPRGKSTRKGGDEMETSLSKLTDGEWSQVSCLWGRGIDWVVKKVGKKWVITDFMELSKGFPLFKTKKAACEAVTNLILRESRCRAEKRITEGK